MTDLEPNKNNKAETKGINPARIQTPQNLIVTSRAENNRMGTCYSLASEYVAAVEACGTVRKRNERERQRVRNVNEGFERLRMFLPRIPKDDAVGRSKVDTLRAAISYIKYLQDLVEQDLNGSAASK